MKKKKHHLHSPIFTDYHLFNRIQSVHWIACDFSRKLYNSVKLGTVVVEAKPGAHGSCSFAVWGRGSKLMSPYNWIGHCCYPILPHIHMSWIFPLQSIQLLGYPLFQESSIVNIDEATHVDQVMLLVETLEPAT